MAPRQEGHGAWKMDGAGAAGAGPADRSSADANWLLGVGWCLVAEEGWLLVGRPWGLGWLSLEVGQGAEGGQAPPDGPG